MNATSERDHQLRFLKTLYWILVAAAIGYVYVTKMMIDTSDSTVEDFGVMRIAFAVLGLVEGSIPMAIRFFWIPKLLDAPPGEAQESPGDFSSRLVRLRYYYILCYVLIESVVLLGLVMGMFSGSLVEGLPYFAAGLLMFALCFPRVPKSQSDPMSGPIG